MSDKKPSPPVRSDFVAFEDVPLTVNVLPAQIVVFETSDEITGNGLTAVVIMRAFGGWAVVTGGRLM